MLKNNRNKTLLTIILLASFFFVVTGCAADPVVSYVEEIEEKGIIVKIDELDDDVQALYAEYDKVVRIDESGIEDFEKLIGMVDEFIEKQSNLITTVENLDTSDAKVKEINDYLVKALSKFASASNYLYVLTDAMIELKDIDENPDREDIEEELNRIIITIFEADEEFNKYIAESEEALDTWESMLDEHFEQ